MIGKNYKVNNKSGISLILSGIALLLFFYISFLGLGYFLEGLFDSSDYSDILPAFLSEIDSMLLFYGIISISYMIILCIMLFLMCSSKSKRNKKVGLPIEITSGIIIVAMLFVGCIPFMKFLYIFEQEDILLQEVEQMRRSAIDVDNDYIKYVENRIENHHYACVRYYDEDYEQVESSLKRRLIPSNFEKLKNTRESWLEQMSVVSIWNPCTAHNIKAVMKASEDWTREYNKLSSLSYQYEIDDFANDAFSFEHTVSKSNRDKWFENFKNIEIPDMRALGAMAIVLILLFSLYMSIDRPRNIITGTHHNS